MLCQMLVQASFGIKHLTLASDVSSHQAMYNTLGDSHVAPRIPIALYSCPWLVSICSQRTRWS